MTANDELIDSEGRRLYAFTMRVNFGDFMTGQMYEVQLDGDAESTPATDGAHS